LQGGIKGGNLNIYLMTELYNKTSEKEKRRSLRNNMPPAEKIVWEKLRNRQIEGCKFRRQYSIDRFVIDFYAPELKLAIEIDGDSHFQDGAQVYDYCRQGISPGSMDGGVKGTDAWNSRGDFAERY
jgi:very-short-patch-repair endonuclease